MKRVYHRKLGLPDVVADQLAREVNIKLTYTTHAMQACLQDRYGPISRPPKDVFVGLFNLVEVDVIDGVITKVVIRIPYDDTFDLVMAVVVDPRQVVRGTGIVKTVWANHRNDSHKTLNTSKYDKP